MYPLNLCGIYILTSCTMPAYIGSQLTLDYSSIHFASVQKRGVVRVTKNMYGSILATNETVKIRWLASGTYDIESPFLPSISYPYLKDRCRAMTCTYSVNDNYIVLRDAKNEYVFRKNLFPAKREDPLLKIFFTQLLLDQIIRHIG